MSTLVEPIVRLSRFQESLITQATSDLTEADWQHRIGPANSAWWIVGHVAACRRETLREMGGLIGTVSWESHFHDPAGPLTGSLSGQALVEDVLASGALLERYLMTLDASGVQRPIDKPWMPGCTTIAGFALFRFWHESYHVGQLGFIRRVLGKPGMA